MKYILLLFVMVSVSFAGIGKITALNGQAYVLRGKHKVSLSTGSEIEKKDLIKTMKNTKLQIVFNDHTVISLGQKTDFKIEDYIFSKSKVKASFAVSKGIFKSITGRIGKIDHSKFKLRTKNATIGVRGTTFIGVVDGDKESIACTSGEIVVENKFGVVAVKAGEMTSFRGFEAPKPAKTLNSNFIKKVKAVKPEINSDNIDQYLSKNVKVIKQRTNIINNPTVVPVSDVASQIQDSENDVQIVQNVDAVVSDTTQTVSDTVSSVTDSVSEGVSDATQSVSDGATSAVETVTDVIDDIGGDFAQQDLSQVDDDTDNVVEVATDIEALKDKVGGATSLHYEGRVNGENVIDENNRVVLDVDLGHASINGNIQFTQRYESFVGSYDNNWNTDVAGNFQGGNTFSLEAVSDGYAGSGSVQLEGDHLQDAVGSMELKKVSNYFGTEIVTSRTDIDIDAHGGAVTGQ